MKTKSKTLALLFTSTVTLGALSLLVVNTANNEDLFFSTRGAGSAVSRTATVNKWNRHTILYSGIKYESSTISPVYFNSVFQLRDGSSYVIIQTSESQYAVEHNDDDCVFTLHGSDCSFTINTTYGDNFDLYWDQAGGTPLDVVKFRRLTKIDIVLDRSDNHNIEDLNCDNSRGVVGGPYLDLENNTATYVWTPNNSKGYLPEGKDLTITGTYVEGKSYWFKELVFYYDC